MKSVLAHRETRGNYITSFIVKTSGISALLGQLTGASDLNVSGRFHDEHNMASSIEHGQTAEASNGIIPPNNGAGETTANAQATINYGNGARLRTSDLHTTTPRGDEEAVEPGDMRGVSVEAPSRIVRNHHPTEKVTFFLQGSENTTKLVDFNPEAIRQFAAKCVSDDP